MKFPRNVKLFRGQLDAAPFAGVFFLLVIFLLLQSRLVFFPGIRIKLPETAGSSLPGLTGPYLMVAIDMNGQYYFENQAIQTQELSVRLREAVRRNKDIVLVIQADKTVSLENFHRLSKLAMESGIREVMIASRPTGANGRQPVPTPP